MLRSIQSLIGYRIHAKDGEIGKVKDFYFDDGKWTIRYFVVDTGNFLPGRKVLISPFFAFGTNTPDWKSKTFPIDLTKAQIEASPSIEADKPVSRQHFIDLHQHYGWTPYWENSMAVVPPVAPIAPEIEKAKEAHEKGDPHLRSTKEVAGYHIQATDGEIGHVEDFVIGDTVWVIRYMVVDTRNWLPGRKVLLSPEWIQSVSWSNEQVTVDLTRDSIKNSPEYDPSAPINQKYELRLYDFYGRPKYWT